MNYYLIVEGITEKKVYKKWIPYLRPELSHVPAIYDISENNFSIISGKGYPQYFDVIDFAIDDVNSNPQVNEVVISIDSEEMTLEDKINEMKDFLDGKDCTANINIMIQHFCFETWALGNKRIGPRNPPRNSIVFEYKNYFNVLTQDPELLGGYDRDELNRSQFAYKYLASLVRQRGTSYSKTHPTAVLNKQYLEGVIKRFSQNGHIRSIKTFLDIFGHTLP